MFTPQGSAIGFVCDLTNEKDVESLQESVRASVGEVNILINNAGVVTGKEFLLSPNKMNRSDAIKDFRQKSTGVFNCSTVAIGPMPATCDHGGPHQSTQTSINTLAITQFSIGNFLQNCVFLSSPSSG